jgi:hypothetical protein
MAAFYNLALRGLPQHTSTEFDSHAGEESPLSRLITRSAAPGACDHRAVPDR